MKNIQSSILNHIQSENIEWASKLYIGTHGQLYHNKDSGDYCSL